jgi:PqqD family protein of HPr-rel-A system
MTSKPIPTPRDDLLERPLQDELALFDVERGAVHTLNPSATIVWRALQSSSDRSDLVSALVEGFDVSDEEAAEGVDAALTQFLETDLARVG